MSTAEFLEIMAGMRNAMLRPRICIRIGLCLSIAVNSVLANADNKLTPPPYVVTGLETITTGVTWEEAAIRTALPPGVVPAKEMTGGINIYKAAGGNGFGAYTAAYLWVDLEGLDSSDGTKGRWMLAGIYGSQEVMAVVQEFYGLPVRNGNARYEATAKGLRAVGASAGHDLISVEAEIDMDKCKPGGGSVSYLSQMPRTKHFILLSDAFWGELCPAQVDSVRIMAPDGDPFAQFKPKSINWAVQFKGSVAVMPPTIRP